MRQTLFDLTGRGAVVTGGTTGLGRAIALGLAAAGADVVSSSRRSPEVEKAAAEIEALGRRSLRVVSDVLDRPSIQALHDAVLAAFGLAASRGQLPRTRPILSGELMASD